MLGDGDEREIQSPPAESGFLTQSDDGRPAASSPPSDLRQLFVNDAPAALAMFDREMRYLHVSQRWRRDYGLGDRELRGSSHYDLFPEIGETWKAVHRRALAGEVVRAERDRFERSDGSVQWVRWEVSPWRGQGGEVGGIIIFAEDITELVRAGEAATRAKSEFLASMTHELRTPLNAILGYAQLILRDKKDPATPRQRERLDPILKAGEQLLRLVDDVLDLARIESGAMHIASESVDIAATIEAARAVLEPMAARHGVTVEEPRLPPSLPALTADPARLVQVLTSFGTNAIKFNHKDGQVGFEVTVDDPGFVRVTVRDTGRGIPLHRQGEIFAAFERAGLEAGPIEGMGVGLDISRRLAALMGGRVGFRSVPDVGSAFWIDLPTTPDGSGRARARSAAHSA